jgi:hypothetical protein
MIRLFTLFTLVTGIQLFTFAQKTPASNGWNEIKT